LPAGCVAVHGAAQLSSLLPTADWLVLACPLTDETRGWIDAPMIAALPPRARLINVSRGEVIDEGALCEALAGGRLAGAYLDVFAVEPLPADSPLWRLPNVIVTPHDSPASLGNAHRVSQLFLDNLRRWRDGAALRNEVVSTKA
jgi:phosphoglycerate dehydrogenase-like enzyme